MLIFNFSDDNKITIGAAYKATSKFDEALFYPISRNENGSRVLGEAVTSGKSRVEASFEGLKASAELLVYTGINLTPSLVILPFDPNNQRS